MWVHFLTSKMFPTLFTPFLVLFIAFYFMPEADKKWSLALVFSVGIINYIYKLTMAVLLTPVIYAMHSIIDKYLGRVREQKQ